MTRIQGIEVVALFIMSGKDLVKMILTSFKMSIL
jgi:hypothetical protein